MKLHSVHQVGAGIGGGLPGADGGDGGEGKKEGGRGVGGVIVHIPKSIAMTAQEYFERGNMLYKEGRNEEALEAYEQAIQRDEKLAAPWNGKGNVYAILRDYEQALYCFDQAIQCDENLANPWNGKGNVFFEFKDYEQAIFCYNQSIQRDENWAYPWYGKGNVYVELDDYEQAIFCHEQAIQTDKNFPYSWTGKGHAHAALNDFEKALFCYEQAIRGDDKTASPWNGKGIVYDARKDYEASKINFIRAFLLEENRQISYNNLFLFSRYPTAPFYTYRLITGHLSADQYSEWKLLIDTTFRQCRNLQAYTAWLQLSVRQQQVKGWEWEVWRGLVHYFMGDPVASFELFKDKALPEQPKDLRVWYYLILSCYGFAEPTEKYMEEALGIAESFVKKQGFWESIGLRKKVVEHKKPDAIQCYYAGQLFLLREDKTKALNCFEQVKEDFLPAAYMCLRIKEQEEKSTKDVLKYICQQEKMLANAGQGFACGIPPQRLDLDRNDFWTPFNRFAHYVEISDGIDLFVYEAEKQGLDIGAPMVTSDEQKNFWDVWLLEKEDYRRIFQLAREVRLQRETEKIFRARTQALKREAKQAEFSPEQAEDHIRQQESERLLDAYEKLVGESSAERREQRLGGMISEWALSKPDHYHTLTTALYLQELFTEQQKVMLDFYARIQHYARQKPSDVLFAGLKDEVKELIGKGIDLLASTLDFSGALLSVVFKPLAKGALGELIIQWLKIRKAEFKTYSEFREGFRQFVGEEKERLGERFEERYPMYGFEEWLR